MKALAEEIQMGKTETREECCPTHGAYTARNIFRSVWTSCPTCCDESAAREKAENEERKRIERQLAWQRRIGQSGIPQRFQDRSLQTFVAETEDQKMALVFATNYADNFNQVLETGRSAVFVGQPGTGKTHLAVGIGLRIMHRDNRTVLFTTVMRAIRRVKDTWSKDRSESESEAVAALVAPDLLILDEVGVQFGSDTEKLILFDVLNDRYEQRQPTLLLSNLTIDGVKAYLGERIFDRLREDGGQFVAFDWASHRGRR